jgi:hypothetical protein
MLDLWLDAALQLTTHNVEFSGSVLPHRVKTGCVWCVAAYPKVGTPAAYVIGYTDKVGKNAEYWMVWQQTVHSDGTVVEVPAYLTHRKIILQRSREAYIPLFFDTARTAAEYIKTHIELLNNLDYLWYMRERL